MVVHFGGQEKLTAREIPRPAGENAGLRDDAGRQSANRTITEAELRGSLVRP
jgi:hypothetical protein